MEMLAGDDWINQLKPFVLRDCISEWPASKWTIGDMDKIIDGGDDGLPIRFGPKTHKKGEILFENHSKIANVRTINEFIHWYTSGEALLAMDGSEVTSDEYWAYYDYKYVFEVMNVDRMDDINWEILGVKQKSIESSIWIGTPGAYTACHFDSYGYNLHAQISGCKRWILFAPNESMRPTRIPYEESSVYSQIDVLGGDERMRDMQIWMVTLNPGEVLFVPNHWWHCVQCVNNDKSEAPIDSISISVNIWVPFMPFDRISNRHEAFTAALIEVLYKSSLFSQNDLCRSETIPSCLDCLEFLESDFKEQETSNSSIAELAKFIELHMHHAIFVPLVSFSELCDELKKGPLELLTTTATSSNIQNQQLSIRDLIDALTSPRVIECCLKSLKESKNFS